MFIMRPLSVVIPLLLLSPCIHAQAPDTTEVENPALRQELLDMHAADLAVRSVLMEKGVDNLDSLDWAQIDEVDAANRKRLEQIIAEHGWPTPQLVGRDGVEAAFLIVQHADHDPVFQREMLPFVEQSYRAGVLSGEEVALLTDRMLTNAGLPQRYGTQVEIRDGEAVVFPLEQPEKVDELRAEMGMIPLKDYLRELKRFYGLTRKNHEHPPQLLSPAGCIRFVASRCP